MTAPQFKQLRRSYGFDEVALVPGDVTVNPEQTDISLSIGENAFSIPILASAMDGVVDVNGARWRATTYRASGLEVGSEIRVVAVEGIVLDVEPAELAEG